MPTEVRDARGRLGGVDSIRAVSSFMVLLGHLSLFSPRAEISSHLLVQISRVSAVLWNGAAAVIVFFIVSGFCIHLPFRGTRELRVGPFLSRRILRVAVPPVMAILLGKLLLHGAGPLYGVLWSVLCELIYYILYPLIRPVAQRIGWPIIFLAAYAVSVALSLANLHALLVGDGYNALGARFTWLIGLPCWLLGCWLAEKEASFPLVSSAGIWGIRAAIFGVSIALRIVKFHVHAALASNCLTLNIFAIAACAWLGYEIAYYKHHKPWAALEWAGSFSYSLYLTHPLVGLTLAALSWSWLTSLTHSLHGFLILFAVILAYVFYLLVERPSHRLAIVASRRVERIEKRTFASVDKVA